MDFTWEGVYIHEKSFDTCICLWQSDRPGVTLCGGQDVKIQLPINKLDLMASSSSVLIYWSSQRKCENNTHGMLTFKGWNSGCAQFQWLNQAVKREMSEVLEMCQHLYVNVMKIMACVGLYVLLTFRGWNSGCVQFQWQNKAKERKMRCVNIIMLMWWKLCTWPVCTVDIQRMYENNACGLYVLLTFKGCMKIMHVACMYCWHSKAETMAVSSFSGKTRQRRKRWDVST